MNDKYIVDNIKSYQKSINCNKKLKPPNSIIKY